MSTKPTAENYLLGASDEELARLGSQHQVWALETQALVSSAGLLPGHTAIDLGCGPGFVTRDLAHRVGTNGHVLAVDGSQRFINHLTEVKRVDRLSQVEPLQADVTEVEITDASADLVFARWLMCFLPDPRSLIKRAAGWLKPGGRLVIMDYLGYEAFALFPRSQAHQTVVKAVIASWQQTGGSLDVAGNIPQMVSEAGLMIESVRPIQRVARPKDLTWRWVETFLTSYIPHLTKVGLLTDEEGEAFWQNWHAKAAMPGAILWPPSMLGLIATRP